MLKRIIFVAIAGSLLCFQAARCAEPETSHIVTVYCEFCSQTGTVPGVIDNVPLPCPFCDAEKYITYEQLHFMPQRSEQFVMAELEPGAESGSESAALPATAKSAPPPVLVRADDETAAVRARAALALSSSSPTAPAVEHVHEMPKPDLSKYTWKQIDDEEAALLKDGVQVGNLKFASGHYYAFDGKAWASTCSEPPITRARKQAGPPWSDGATCAGGCGPKCGCAGVAPNAKASACPCAENHRIHPAKVSAAPVSPLLIAPLGFVGPPKMSYFTSAKC